MTLSDNYGFYFEERRWNHRGEKQLTCVFIILIAASHQAFTLFRHAVHMCYVHSHLILKKKLCE